MLSRDLLLEALEHLPDPVTLLRAVRDGDGRPRDFRIEYLNRAALVRQIEPETATGAVATDLWPQMETSGALAACLRALETGLPQAGAMLFRPDDGGSARGYDYRAVPLDADALLWSLRDTGSQLQRAQVLADVTTALARTEGFDDVAELLVETAVRGIGAAASAVAVEAPEPGRYRVHTSRGFAMGGGVEDFATDAPYPIAHVLRTGEPLFFADAEERARAFPEAEEWLAGYPSTAVLPLAFHEHAFGAVTMHFAEHRAFDDDERGFLAALAAQCAQALERARALADARRRRAQMFALSEVGAVLASSLDLDTTLDNVAATVVGALADACLIHLRDGDGPPRLAAVAHREAELLPEVVRLAASHPPPLDDAAWAAAGDAASGDAVRADQVVVQDADGPRAYARLVAPLRHRGEVQGALMLVNDARRGFPAGDVPFASELARRSEVAVANAQAYSSQREIAHQLQLSLLSTPTVSAPGLQVAARYRPAQADAHVGGDWYDMFELADGRIAVVIGDVMGHDITAAAAMGQLRTLLRGLSYDGATPPDAILRRLDEINAGLAITDFATVALVNVDAVTPGGPAVLRISSAGHLPPLVLHPDGRTELVGSPNDPPLGVGTDVARRCERLELPPGATLLLYTDGLVETRDAVLTDRLALLERVASALHDRAPGDLLDELLAVFDGHADDVAMLALRVEAAR